MLVLYYLLILRENEWIGSIYSLTWTRYLFVKNLVKRVIRIFVQAIHVFAYMFTVNVESSANHFLLYVRSFARFVAITIQNLCKDDTMRMNFLHGRFKTLPVQILTKCRRKIHKTHFPRSNLQHNYRRKKNLIVFLFCRVC